MHAKFHKIPDMQWGRVPPSVKWLLLGLRLRQDELLFNSPPSSPWHRDSRRPQDWRSRQVQPPVWAWEYRPRPH